MKNIQKIYDRSISQTNLLSPNKKQKLKPINLSSIELESNNNNISKRLKGIYSKMPKANLNLEFNIVSNQMKMSKLRVSSLDQKELDEKNQKYLLRLYPDGKFPSYFS